VSDRELRELERRWRESGSPEDRQRWLLARQRLSGKSEVLLLTEDALAERGAEWFRAQLPEALAAAAARPAYDVEQARWTVEGLLQMAFGPIALSPSGYDRPQLDLSDPLPAAEALLSEHETYVRVLLELVERWPQDPSGALAVLAERVAELTHADDSWYYDVGQSTAELLRLLGMEQPDEDALELVAEFAFTSWVLRPGDARRFGAMGTLTVAASRLASRYPSYDVPHPGTQEWRPVLPEALAREALAPHLLATLSLSWDSPPSLPTVAWRETAALEAYQQRFDGPAHGDDPLRAQRFAAALARVRALADGEQALTFGDLVAIQGDVLGEPATVRTAPALAKEGAETYAWFPAFESLVRAKLDADLADGCPPLAKAARLYLDLIYLHPFEDGNARAARLALELVLRRAGLPTPALAPLVRFPKPAGDASAYRRFLEALAAGVDQA